MRRALDRAVAQLSALLLLSGVCLIGASLLGVGTGPLLFGALLAATVALYLARDAVPRIERFPEWALADLGSDLWLAPLIAASAVLVAPGATPGEVQSIGGLVGLVALIVYFARPLIPLAAGLYGRVAGGRT
jgi:hypothetical protein